MKKIFFGSLLLIALFNSANAQQHLVDSILKELKQDLPDTTRAISMMRLAVDYELVDTAKAHIAYKEAI